MNRVAVAGSINMDLVLPVEHLPIRGETVLGGELLLAPGGKGANQAVAAARLGAEVALVGCVGEDDVGGRLLASLREAGVRTGAVRVVPGSSGLAMIVVAPDGGNYIAVAPGANAVLRAEDVAIGDAEVVLAQLEVPLVVVSRAGELAREARVPFILNAAPAQEIGALLPLTTVLVVNEAELASLGGSPAELLAEGPAAVIVTLGERGADVFTQAGRFNVAAPNVAAVDSTGAGDAFCGALATRYDGIGRLEEAVRYACMAGALACTKRGAQPSLPTAAEVEALLAGS